jgi:ribulose-phosphate 3-epimerase
MKANVHFMVQNPFSYIRKFSKFPINSITFHPEAVSLITTRTLIYYMKMKHIPCGLAIKPHTNISKYVHLLKICDYVLIMSVQPGMGGQSFLPESMENLKKARAVKDIFNKKLIIQLDGGVNLDVISLTESYVDQYIMGSYLMKQTNVAAFLQKHLKK